MTNAEKLIRQINDDWNDGNINTLVSILDHSCCRFCDNHVTEPIRTEHDGQIEYVTCLSLANHYNNGTRIGDCDEPIREYLMKEEDDVTQ